MRKLLSLIAFLLPVTIFAQTYDEPSAGNCADPAAWQALGGDVHFTWADADVHYDRCAVPDVAQRTDTTIVAWGGERVGFRGLLYSARKQGGNLTLNVKPAPAKGRAAAPALQPRASWLRYVLTDSFSTCGYHPDSLAPYCVAEVVDLPGSAVRYSPCEVRPFWVSVEVPRDLPAGDYAFSLSLRGAKAKALTFNVKVLDSQLPEPHDYAFHLDLWQQPYSVSRYYGVEPWSDAHFELLRPYMQELARLGQKVVSAILFYEPWGQQSNDKFQAMIQTTHCADGSWSYDYSVFDRWVEFMASCGIDEQIDCYSMVPWDMTFCYYDEATEDSVSLKTTTDTPEYRDLWISYLRAFASHLREKGWFDKTCIAMDERGLDDMLRAYHVAQYAVPGIRMTLAGNYHKELVDLLHDYAVAYGQTYGEGEVDARRARGQHSNFYTCCTDAHPGLFSNSNPVDATFIPLYCAAADFDGWLHWSWLNWTDDPLRDSRFFLFAPGDTYFYYPGPRSSLRHERLLEGIQQYEKLVVKSANFSDETVKNCVELATLFRDITNCPAQRPDELAQLLARFKAFVNR